MRGLSQGEDEGAAEREGSNNQYEDNKVGRGNAEKHFSSAHASRANKKINWCACDFFHNSFFKKRCFTSESIYFCLFSVKAQFKLCHIQLLYRGNAPNMTTCHHPELKMENGKRPYYLWNCMIQLLFCFQEENKITSIVTTESSVRIMSFVRFEFLVGFCK